MKAIILAGGKGSRLYPLTSIVTKQLQPVYDKPMIFYPLSVLMLTGIRDVLIITNPGEDTLFRKLLGDGSAFGINIQYTVQENPNGLPEAFILGEKFIGSEDVALILGDNLFYGDLQFLKDAVKEQLHNHDLKAHVFAYYVSNPQDYGVVEFDIKTKKILSIEEKPLIPKSNYAIPGVYIFDNSVIERSKRLKPSKRGELEIVDLIKSYFEEGNLGFEVIRRGVAWLDTGSPKALLEASEFIGAIEARQGLKVACLEEISLRMGYITVQDVKMIIEKMPNCDYKNYLKKIITLDDFTP